MAEKRYYWLKLKEDYFNSPKIKKLRKIAGGDTFTIIYLKMQLLSVRNEGIIQFEGIEQTFAEELALKLDEDLENVNVTLNYLQSQCLLEVNDNNEFMLLEANNNIGSEGQSAERKRRFDEKKKALLGNSDVTDAKRISISNSDSKSISSSNITIEDIEKDIFNYWNSKDIIKHREMTDNIKKEITKALKLYSKKEIETYIDRYAETINDKSYFFDYKWTLVEFLSRKDGISSFTDEGSKWTNYIKQTSKNCSSGSKAETIFERTQRILGGK